MKGKAQLLFVDLQKSVAFLGDVLAQPYSDYMRAAAIQAFEVCFELSWKYLQIRLNEAGIESNSPRITFRQSGEVGLLDNVEAWLIFTEQRNLTVHTYHPQLAMTVYEMIRNDFMPAITRLLETAAPDKEI